MYNVFIRPNQHEFETEINMKCLLPQVDNLNMTMRINKHGKLLIQRKKMAKTNVKKKGNFTVFEVEDSKTFVSINILVL